MVCIAAFIILALIGIFVAVISIFKPEVGKSYLKMLKKSWGCLGKKVRLQKCETGFKDDVKNTILSRVIVKHPKWVRPLSIIIEVVSVIIVIVAVWAILTAVKSLLALWALGSCNVTKPSACSMGAEICSIDESEPSNVFEATGRWFTEWGDIFEAIPEKFRTYDLESYDFSYIITGDEVTNNSDKPLAIDIFDPGCSVCMMSYRNQKEQGFFDKYNTHLVPFPIQDADGNYKFRNSALIVRYLLAAEQFRPGLAIGLLDRLFTEKDENGTSYQNLFNDIYTEEEAVSQLEKWLGEASLDAAGVAEVREIAGSSIVADDIAKNQNIIVNELNIRGIPTIFYDGSKHTGLFK